MTTITYNPNTPENPSDSLDISQPDLLNNFISLYNSFKNNHVPLDALVGAGNHSIIQLKETDHSLQTDLDEVSVYSKDVANQTDQVFLRYQNNGQEFQFTNYQIYTIDNANFFTFLPGNNIIYFGSFTSLPNNTLNLVPPVSKNIVSASICPMGTVGQYKPWIYITGTDEGYYNRVTFNSPISVNSYVVPPCSYLFWGNT